MVFFATVFVFSKGSLRVSNFKSFLGSLTFVVKNLVKYMMNRVAVVFCLLFLFFMIMPNTPSPLLKTPGDNTSIMLFYLLTKVQIQYSYFIDFFFASSFSIQLTILYLFGGNYLVSHYFFFFILLYVDIVHRICCTLIRIYILFTLSIFIILY